MFSAIIVLFLAYISYIDKMSLVLLLIVQVLVSFSYGFFDPATKGMIPQLVEEDELTKTNSKVATLRILSGIVAPLIAVSLYTAYGVTILFIINGVSFLLSGSSEMFIRYKHIAKESKEGIKGIMEDMAEGAKFIKNNEIIRKFSLYFLVVFAFIQPVFGVILPLFYRAKLNYPDTQYGILQVALFVGALLGSIAVGVFVKEDNFKKALVLGITSVVASMCIFAGVLLPGVVSAVGNDSIGYFILFSAVLFIQYTSIMFITIPLQTVIQKATPNEYMSRVFSIVGLISKGGMPLGALVYGLILGMIEIHTATMIAAAIILMISVRFLTTFRKVKEF